MGFVTHWSRERGAKGGIKAPQLFVPRNWELDPPRAAFLNRA
jgi:hypothetical protein